MRAAELLRANSVAGKGFAAQPIQFINKPVNRKHVSSLPNYIELMHFQLRIAVRRAAAHETGLGKHSEKRYVSQVLFHFNRARYIVLHHSVYSVFFRLSGR